MTLGLSNMHQMFNSLSYFNYSLFYLPLHISRNEFNSMRNLIFYILPTRIVISASHAHAFACTQYGSIYASFPCETNMEWAKNSLQQL